MSAAESTEAAGGTTPQGEAQVLADDVEEARALSSSAGGPLIVGFVPRIVDSPIVADATTLLARFPIPEGCTPTGEALRIDCEEGELALQAVAMSLDGDQLAHKTEVSGSGIVVTAAPEDGNTAGYIFTI